MKYLAVALSFFCFALSLAAQAEFPTNIYAVETPAPGRVHLSMRLSGSGSGGSLGLLYSSDDGGQSWASAGSVHRPVRALHFPTESNGYGVGDYGLFVYTANGGRDWQVDTIASGGNHFNAVHFKNTSTGYASTTVPWLDRTQEMQEMHLLG